MEFYAEWLDSYFARDVQELFRVEKRRAYLQLAELLLRQSGGMCEMATLGQQVGLSRPTVATYMDALEVTQVIHIVRPFHGGRQEIVRQPRVFGFDTGFVAYARHMGELRDSDCGPLWEQLTLETRLAIPNLPAPHFWRDKAQREVDFVVAHRDGTVDAIECKWQADHLEARGLAALRAVHPNGRNFVVAPDAVAGQVLTVGGLAVQSVDLVGLALSYGVVGICH